MLRTTSRLRVTAKPLMQCMAKSQYHQLPFLQYDTEKGLDPFLSAQSLDFLYNMRQVDLINNVNRLSEGTEFESGSLLKTVIDSADFPKMGALHNHASQAWNNDFFLQSLTNQSAEPREDVKRILAEGFGSFDRFKELFTQIAISHFSNGWTWLATNMVGKLVVFNTFGSTTPFTSLPSKDLPGLKGVSYTRAVENKSVYRFYKLSPILGLSMWQEAFLPDYGLNREAYIENFWKVIDWSVVHDRFTKSQRRSQMS